MAELLAPPTRSGLLPEARHLVLPDGIVATGFPRVRDVCRSIGIEFDPWQVDLNQCLLAKTADGLYAADTAVLSIPRQVGKTFDIGAVVFAECIAEPGMTVVWTAHRFKVARETFNDLRSLARSPKLAPHIDYDAITTAAGNECIPFRNGSRIIFAARERGAIRGFSKVRILVLDEAQILTHSVLADLAPTMNQAENPLIILMGTPPKPSDPGEVFTEIRADALAGTSEGIFYVELSAERGCDLDDRDAWRQGNLSFPSRTPARAILRMRKLLSDEDFAREGLGIWDDDGDGTILPEWPELLNPRSSPERPVAFAVDTDPDQTRTSIGVACSNAAGTSHVEVVENAVGSGWVVDRLVELNKTWKPCAIVVDPRSASAALLADLADAGVEVTTVTASEYAQACGALFNAVRDRELSHRGDEELTTAVRGAKTRPLGDAWAWDRKKHTVDITPLVAVTLARWGWATKGRSRKRARFYNFNEL